MNDTTTIVHKFGSGILVEIIGSDEYGDISTETYEFDVLESGEKRLVPREEIPSKHKDRVCAALSQKGYSVDKL